MEPNDRSLIININHYQVKPDLKKTIGDFYGTPSRETAKEWLTE